MHGARELYTWDPQALLFKMMGGPGNRRKEPRSPVMREGHRFHHNIENAARRKMLRAVNMRFSGEK